MKKLWSSLLMLLTAITAFSQGDPVIHYPMDYNSAYSESLRGWDLLTIKGNAQPSADRSNNPTGAISLAPGSFVEFQDLQQLAKMDSLLSDSIFQQHITFSCWLRYDDLEKSTLIFNTGRYPGDSTSVIKLNHDPAEGYYSSYLYGEQAGSDPKHWEYHFNEYTMDLRSQAPVGAWVKLVYVSSGEGTDLYIQVPDAAMPTNPYKVKTYSYHSYLSHRPMDQFLYWYLGSSRNTGNLNIDDVKFYDEVLDPEDVEDQLDDDMGEYFQADTVRDCYERILAWNDSATTVHEILADNLLDSILSYSDVLFAQNQDTALYLTNINRAFQLSDSLKSFQDTLLMTWNDSAYAVCDSLFDQEAVPSGDCYTQAQQLNNLIFNQITIIHNEILDSAYTYNDSVFAYNNDTVAYNQSNTSALAFGDSIFNVYDSTRVVYIDSVTAYCDLISTPNDSLFESTCYNEILHYADSVDLFNNSLRTVFLDSTTAYNDSLYALDNDSVIYALRQQVYTSAGDSIYNYHNTPLQEWVASAFQGCDSIHLPTPPIVEDTCQESLQHLTDSIYNLIDFATQSFRDSAYGYHDSILALSGDTNLYYMEREAAYRASIDLQNSHLNQLYNWADSAYAACGIEFTPRGIIPESDCYDLIIVMADSLYENAGLSRTAFIDSTTAYEDSVLLATQDTLTYQMNLSTANQFADDLLQNLHTNIQAAINAATELCNAQFDPASWGEPGVSCYDEILTYGNSWEEQNKMVSEAFHDSASAYVDSLYTVNNDPEWYQQAKWLAFYSSDSVYQHLDAFRVSWMDSAYTACDSIFNYQPADGPALPSDEDCYATISAHHDSAYAYMDSLRMAFTDSAYAYNDSVYVYDNDYGQYEYNLNLISAQSDSIYYFYDAQLMSWNDSAYAYCDSLANSCTDQIMTWQDSIWSYNESIETTMMDSVQAYHHTLFAADHNYIQYLINVNEATSYVDSILDIDRDRFSLQLDSAFAYCDSLNPGEMDPCYGPVQLWMDSTYSYHNSLMSLYLDSANSWNDNDHSNRYQSDINAFIAMAQSYNDSSNNWWSANVITPWGDSTGTFYNSLITALEDSARGWNDTTYTIGDSTHTWNDSIITYKTDSAQAWANQLVIYGTDSLWGEALSGVILWTDSMINWASGIFDSENDSIYMYHEQNIMAWSDSAWTAVNDVVSLYSDSAYAYCDSLYNPPMPADTSCYGLATAYSDSVFMVNDQFRISYIDSAEAYHYEIYLQDDDYQKYLDNYDASILVADSIFLIMENLRYAWMDSAYAYCDSLNNPPLPPDTSCYGLVMTFSDSLYFYNDNLRLTYLDSAYAYNDSVYMATSDSTQYFNANNMAMTFADSTFSFLEMQRNMAVDSAYGYCNELNPDPVSSCYNYVNQVNDSILNYNNNARTLYNDSIYAYSDSVYAWNNDYDLYIATVETGYQYADSIYSLREQQRIAWEDSARASCDSLNYYLMGPCYGPVQAWVDSTYRHYNDVYSEFADSAYTWNSNDFNTRSATAMQSVDSLISYTDSTEYYTLLYSVITVWMDSTNNYHLPIIAATTDSARAWNDSTHTYGDSLHTWYDSTITAQSDSAYYWLNLLTSNWQDSTWSLHYSNFYAWSDSVRAYWNYLYDPYQDSIYLANNNMIYIQTDSIWQFGDALVVTYRDSANAYCDSLTNNPAAQVTPDHSVNTLLTDSYTNTEEWTWNSTVTTPTGPDKLVTEEPYNTNPLQFSVFPNPAHHKIHILYESPTAQEITIYMANLDGSLLHFEKVRIPQGRYTYTFPDLMELASKFTHLQSVVIGLKTQDEDLSEIVLIK